MVVPFGARAAERPGNGGGERTARRPGAWARQLARRLVDRFAQEPAVELRPVFLVAMPASVTENDRSAAPEAGYLIFGSTPDPKLAAEYGSSLGAAYAVTGTYRETGSDRRLDATLIDVPRATAIASLEHRVAPEQLHLAEGALATWLAGALGVEATTDLSTPAVASEPAYTALLEGMDAEVDVTLLRTSDPDAARSALRAAATAYAAAVRADPASTVVEDRILVMGATAIERDEQPLVMDALEALAGSRPSSWRAHYMLGEVRRTSGEVSGAIVAFEHADALQPLRDQDSLLLARLYIATGAGASAVSRLGRIIRRSEDPEIVASARRLKLSVRHPELERVLEEAGQAAVQGDVSRAADADAGFGRVLAVEPRIWEAHFGRGLLALQRGDADAARASFDRARELNPASEALIATLETGGGDR